ncbi:unnamed protein product [Candidula unifasciata]|uniref:Uncharacterized protein n=1 Tax=Candidula unifasciata TaxID=100452 RepID=A0A8S3ZN27_9EUPU|nr:unnamed protein product [Candidula unifasciata]
MDKKRILMLGVASALVTIGGIILAVLLDQTGVTFGDGYTLNNTNATWEISVDMFRGRLWPLSLVYIIPGFIGIVGAFLQNKCMCVITCIFTMLSLLIAGLFAIITGLSLIVFIFSVGIVSENCKDEDDICKCRNPVDTFLYEYKDTPFKTCAHLEKLKALVTAILVFIILAWLAELMEFIFSCYFSCRTKAYKQNCEYLPQKTGGVVLSTQQPMLQGTDNKDYPLPTKV